ncbi:photosynthetic reaction center subunit M [bacterium]|nr:photosynthetic reaction center subunit M [bacterium]
MRYTVTEESILAGKVNAQGQEPAIKRVQEGAPVSFADMEAEYKKPGGTILHALFGADPFDFWFGRFYVGTFGVLSLVGIFFGVVFYFYQAYIVEGVRYNILQARIDPPPISAGLRLVGSNEPGFYWQLIMFFGTLAFLGWLLRQVDISRKLGMSYEIPIAFGAVVSSWITLQWLRPIAMGAWGNGFSLGITHHLDWVSNIGYQYWNFFYNPFHAIGITLLFASTLLLAMHGSVILSAAQRPYIREGNEDGFWRNLLGYSIGEIGIHRIGLWIAAASVLFSNLCIFLSGTLVSDWAEFWAFWDRIPVWESVGTIGFVMMGVIVWRGRVRGKYVDPREYEYGPSGLEGTFLKRTIYVPFFKRLFGEGQVGPVYLGFWGVLSVVAGGIASFIIIEHYLWYVDYNPIAFLREFWVLTLDPPPAEFGLGFGADWHGGSAWIFATFLLHVSVLAWLMRIWRRARTAGLGSHLFWGYVAALVLYFVIYLIRPLIMGTWSQASGHGFKAILDWTNNVSIQTGNFYYNPFHMLSIFFLLGSTLLLAMHGASIVATAKWGSHKEVEEMMAEGEGTHRAQLFWRWTMGFQATSKSIHDWAWWFGALTGITGAIGLLLSGTVIKDWFQWAVDSGFVAPPF